MQFLRMLLWVMILLVLGMISFRNWDTYVPVQIFNDPVVWFRLPVLIVGAMLVGFLPYYFIHKASRWNMGRKLDRAERQLAEVRTPVSAPAEPTAPRQSMPPAAAPIAVPPGVS